MVTRYEPGGFSRFLGRIGFYPGGSMRSVEALSLTQVAQNHMRFKLPPNLEQRLAHLTPNYMDLVFKISRCLMERLSRESPNPTEDDGWRLAKEVVKPAEHLLTYGSTVFSQNLVNQHQFLAWCIQLKMEFELAEDFRAHLEGQIARLEDTLPS